MKTRPCYSVVFVPIILLVSLILSACAKDMTADPEAMVPVFDRQEVTMTADTDIAVLERPIELTVNCHPIVEGVGRLLLHGGSGLVGSLWSIEAPITDTIWNIGGESRPITIPVTFSGGAIHAPEIRVRLLTARTSYAFDATVYMDSVYIADSARMYPINSSTVRLSSPEGRGYNPVAYTRQSGVALP